MSKLRETVVSYCYLLSNLKLKEQGGNNKGQFVEIILKLAGGHAGQPWCVALTDMVYEMACKYCVVKPIINPGLSSSALFRDAEKKGLVRTLQTAKNGDIVLYRGGNTGHFHAGILLATDGNEIKTCEGNTGSGSMADGDGIYIRHRKWHADLADFVAIEK